MAETSSIRQFLVLLYKGALLRKRHYIVTFFEIVVPIFIASIFPMILSIQYNPRPDSYKFGQLKADPNYHDPIFYRPFTPYNNSYSWGDIQFVYTPSNDIIDKFVVEAVERFRIKSHFRSNITIHAETSEAKLERYCLYTQTTSDHLVMIGTVFNNFSPDMKGLPDSLNYKIRYGDSNSGYDTFQTNQKYRMNGPSDSTKYRYSYFLGWQAAVEESFIESKMNNSGKTLDYETWLQRFPYPAYKDSINPFSVISLTPLVLGYGYFIFMINLLRRLIEEKSNGSKELMKMMGMTDTVYWISTFVNYFIVGFITILAISIIYVVPLKEGYKYLPNTSFAALFPILLLYVICMILFCMAFTIFFNKAVYAIIAFIVYYNVSFNLLFQYYFIPGTSNDNDYLALATIAKLAICLLPTGNLLTLFRIISFYEVSGTGLRWSHISDSAGSPDFNMLEIFWTMVFTCFLYSVIIWYFDKVWPWQPGVPQPFYFMFTKSYWCSSKPKDGEETELLKQIAVNKDYFEEEPKGVAPGVAIQNMSKAFQAGVQTKLAVNNVSLNMYRGQITALLGHNGAGKTTTINILTGLYSPTSGTASINGLDILTNTSAARKGLGVCPQHNVLFDTLTVDEHLKIFAGLKGIQWRQLGNEALKVLEILKLTNKRYELVKNLSGGMKRKLSLANAMVGGSNVLFLDEPTSGLDVEARRSVWDALLDVRHDRTIILTTHYMEEADILGDRIAIMAEGEIQCCGSPMFLKRQFGTGYHLHMVKGPGFNVDETNALLKKHMPDITLKKELENELTYGLSSNSGSVFGDMFEELENRKEKLGINSCGITITTMEDVFLQVSNISELKYKEKGERRLQNGVSMEYEDVYGSSRQLKRRNLGNQFFALLEKRFHYSRRHWGILITQLVLPLLLICMCFYSIKNTQNKFQAQYEPLNLDINSVYGKTDGFYYSTTDKKLTQQIVSVLKENDIAAKNVSNDNPSRYILEYGKDLAKYDKNFLVGESVDQLEKGKINLTAWYNGEPYHALPMSLLMLHTAVLKHVSSNEASITLINAPLPKMLQQYSFTKPGVLEGSFASVFIPLALGFVSAAVVLVPIHERTTKAQLLQLMTGVPHALYWTSMFLWDFVLYFINSFLLIIPFAAFYGYVFFASHSNAIGTTLLILWLYGLSSIPLSYLISFIFKKGNTGFAVIVAMSVIMGIAVSSILTSVLDFTTGTTKATLEAFVWVFRLFPPFALSSGINKLFIKAYNNAYCEGIPGDILEWNCNSPTMKPENTYFKCCKNICNTTCLNQTSFIQWDVNACGRDILFLALDGIIFFSFLIILETSFYQTVIRKLKLQFMKLKKSGVGQINHSSITEDSDVIVEEQRIHNLYDTHGSYGNEALVSLDLTKIFRNFYAVDHLSVGIHQEECFGLLGVNGAGKTTTFRMLTGDCHPTAGNAFTPECSLLADTKKFQSYLGYCPQFDALIDRLTGRETLTLYARLRGMTGPELRERVDKLIRMTDLAAHADKQTRFYSGGNKRKLSVGMALIGSPPLILLDEPTAGVDPVSRRKIWNILAQARNFTKAAIILTTHSMEESEALCSRLAIMVNGRFRCLGSIQQLKSKFGQGYTLIIKMKRETADNPQSVHAIKTFIDGKLRAELKDDHQGMLQYHIIDPSVRLSQLFKLMEGMKVEFNLEDYLISDTSLEQIFLTFARAQRITE